MRWSLSEFLNQIELRSQTWCFADVRESGGFNIPHNEKIIFYAVMSGKAGIVGLSEGSANLAKGDILMILSGDAHAVRSQPENATRIFDFLHNGEYVDIPPSFTIGEGAPGSRLLCGRLKIRWPGDQRPEGLPCFLKSSVTDGPVNYRAVEPSLEHTGSSALLTRAAGLVFTAAFRAHRDAEKIFLATNRLDPVSRAKQFLEIHPFKNWTVETLARKVGMGRSNFASQFSSNTGQTPIEYLMAIRMQHAARMLKETDLTLSVISERIGYRSEAAFSRRFTAYFGMSPGRMRKAEQTARR